MSRQLHLNLFIHGRGHHEAAWRHPAASTLALTDIRYYQDLAQRAESKDAPARGRPVYCGKQRVKDAAGRPSHWVMDITCGNPTAAGEPRLRPVRTLTVTPGITAAVSCQVMPR